MENMTAITRKMYDRAIQPQSIDDAARILRENGEFRTLGEIFRSFSGCDNPKSMLVDGLMSHDPSANRDSVDRKVRNWLNGRTHTISRHDAYALSQILKLPLEQADMFLKMITGDGIHWRNPEEIAWSYAIVQSMDYVQTQKLLERVKALGKLPKATLSPAPESYTAEIREKLQPVLYQSQDELLDFLVREQANLGTFHNTAFRLFTQFMDLLEQGYMPGVDIEELFFKDEDAFAKPQKMSTRNILETYLYRKLVPIVKKESKKDSSIFSGIQRSIRANWPDESTISKMKNREQDVSRKVLILLFLATDGNSTEFDEMDEEDDEDILTPDQTFQNIYSRLNLMLHSCGFQQLDPRSPFDWIVLYSICIGDLWETDQRLRDMLLAMFSGEDGET